MAMVCSTNWVLVSFIGTWEIKEWQTFISQINLYCENYIIPSYTYYSDDIKELHHHHYQRKLGGKKNDVRQKPETELNDDLALYKVNH